ncbi:hypothetical protein VTN77DRAFT_5582 [Rasamsonia byssochlamydoides]|uniref:uncharacterized protein n=1 Tax=Rasamsonia byssochlamydoides TaxID=89139 RepID=UPI003743BBDF
MSSIPLAKWSTISDLTVIPDKWESYPIIERSTVQSCSFQNLTSSTSIQRSNLNRVTLQSHSSKGKGSYIKRSKLTDSVVVDSSLKRSKLSHCVLIAVGHAKWSKAQGSHLDQVRRLKRSAVEDSSIRNTKDIKWSTVQRSSVTDSPRIKRSTVRGVRMTNSVVDRSSLVDCDVVDCEIYRTNFTGMVLANGIWRDGQLVGRTSEKEVVVRPKEDIDKKGYGPSASQEQGQSKLINIGMETADDTSSTSSSSSSSSCPTETAVPVTAVSEKDKEKKKKDKEKKKKDKEKKKKDKEKEEKKKKYRKRSSSDSYSDSSSESDSSSDDTDDSVHHYYSGPGRESLSPPPPYEE